MGAAVSRIAAWVLCAFALAIPRVAAPATDGGVLVLGRISDDPKAHYDQLKPLLEYVVAHMEDLGVRHGRILMAKDAQQMASYLRRGRVDWVTETAGSAMLLAQRAGARPLLITEREGVSRYHTVFFARRDGAVDALADLPGHSVAFQRPASTSAYFVPAATLLDQRFRLELLLSPTDAPGTGAVGYLFARSELNIATWVHKRLVDVGVMSNLDWNNPRRVPPAFRPDLRIIARTPDYPRAVEMVRADLDPRIAARLREVLLRAHADPQAQDALRRFFATSRFLPVDDAARRELERVSAGVRRVREEVE
ncbi:phosphate/phosphite/phosphonate ABC transporter substrate-binding protein [Vulcaniibacterium thermophilum]|uniref:Phosphate-binding protein n=1 Tax=Vulcaniibacterium thermophilum TaxID=1169913 RepID=A0A918YWU9_9GAMM|nr:phosphate/phosphite/phosphonate ABC transporter substrate-binding protein [Vulcaniibacterium thermophilum]GHE25223.1 phosphate-binding protein [Vulcaniibacterium thermophilum]